MLYEIRILQPNGGASTLRLDAANLEAAAEHARRQGYGVLKIRAMRSFLGWASADERSFSLGLFSQELLMLLEAGLSVVEAIETLSEKESKPGRRRLLGEIVRHLYEGQSLSQALEQFPSIFPPLYIATVHASEQSGDLPVALGRYVSYQAQLDTVKKKIVSAAIYPLLLSTVGLLVMVFLLAYVVPRFSRIFGEIGGPVPVMSRLMIRWGTLVHDHGWSLLLALSAGLAILVLWLLQASTRQWIVVQLGTLPAIGERLRMYQLARFYRTVGMLLLGGTAIMAALQMASHLLQGAMRRQLAASTQRIREGMPISTAMESCGLTTSVSLRMLRVGEKTGRMGEMMERVAHFYDEDIARWVDWFLRLFEPLLMAFIGIVIGAIVVMMYFPIFELAGSIQ